MRTAETKQLNGAWTQWINAPNAVSSVRIFLAPLVSWTIIRGHDGAALGLFAVAALSDFFDGYLARNSHSTTLAGQYLDPIADKFLLCVVFVALGRAALVPWWFVAIVFGRDLALLVASVIAMNVSRYDNYRPTIWGKLSTALQILAATAALALPHQNAYYVVIASTVATLWSAVHYTYRGISFFFTNLKA